MLRRRILVTSASKGIGRAVADRLAGGGHDVIGLARTAPSDFPGQFREVDLADRAASAAALEAIVGKGTVDAVVNNVGYARFGRIGSIDLDDLFATYDMNVRTAVQVVQAVLPGMIDAKWGRIVNVTSLTTLGVAERTPYAASKAALETCTRIWAGELAATGITVNAVSPGPIETEMFRAKSPGGVRTRSPVALVDSVAACRHSRGDRPCDRHAAARRRRLPDGSDRSGRRGRQHRRGLAHGVAGSPASPLRYCFRLP
jgi:NAD(P)-dependent dehydrogenase (short-subunit alcohol dehydrogenase family)